MISFQVKATNGSLNTIEIPEGINLSLMEVLKASEYPILATCGGMALCATCHVEIEQGSEQLGSPTDIELDMIDTLPNAGHSSRLACQIKVDDRLQGAVIALKEPTS
jgi:ferredoxin